MFEVEFASKKWKLGWTWGICAEILILTDHGDWAEYFDLD